MAKTYAIYLRKSRMDITAESNGQGDTLERHRKRLQDLARYHKFAVTKIYEEIVSGETITSRPQMQQLLHDVEAGLYAGVLVMEVERLARGDTIDQGLVARAFQYSNTNIVTPTKIYDPGSEFDQEYFEFGLFMSRREYKTINRRQQAGRLASVQEGKWPWNKAPYGYQRIKLPDQKGWTLEPSDTDFVVQDIFRWYTSGIAVADGSAKILGVARIVRELNDRHIPSPSGKDWTNCAIQTILRNPAYAGWVRRGHRQGVKTLKDGALTVSRPRAKPTDAHMVLAKGLHVPLVDQSIFDQAQSILALNTSRSGPKQMATANPLAGLVKCDTCGRSMVRRPYSGKRKSTLICAYTSCPTVGSDLDVVEQGILTILAQWVDAFDSSITPQDTSQGERISIQKSITTTQKELSQVETQITNAYDLVERGVYTVELFAQRLDTLTQRKESIEATLTTLYGQMETLARQDKAKTDLIPAVRHILAVYSTTTSPGDKNDLLKTVISSVSYHKSVGGRYKESDLVITVYPKI